VPQNLFLIWCRRGWGKKIGGGRRCPFLSSHQGHPRKKKLRTLCPDRCQKKKSVEGFSGKKSSGFAERRNQKVVSSAVAAKEESYGGDKSYHNLLEKKKREKRGPGGKNSRGPRYPAGTLKKGTVFVLALEGGKKKKGCAPGKRGNSSPSLEFRDEEKEKEKRGGVYYCTKPTKTKKEKKKKKRRIREREDGGRISNNLKPGEKKRKEKGNPAGVFAFPFSFRTRGEKRSEKGERALSFVLSNQGGGEKTPEKKMLSKEGKKKNTPIASAKVKKERKRKRLKWSKKKKLSSL